MSEITPEQVNWIQELCMRVQFAAERRWAAVRKARVVCCAESATEKEAREHLADVEARLADAIGRTFAIHECAAPLNRVPMLQHLLTVAPLPVDAIRMLCVA